MTPALRPGHLVTIRLRTPILVGGQHIAQFTGRWMRAMRRGFVSVGEATDVRGEDGRDLTALLHLHGTTITVARRTVAAMVPAEELVPENRSPGVGPADG